MPVNENSSQPVAYVNSSQPVAYINSSQPIITKNSKQFIDIMPNRFELLKKEDKTRVMGIFPNLYEGKIDTCIKLNDYNIKAYNDNYYYI